MTFTPLHHTDLDAMLAVEGHWQRTAVTRFAEEKDRAASDGAAGTDTARSAAVARARKPSVQQITSADHTPSAAHGADASVATNAPRPSINDEPYPEAGPQAEASPAGTGAGTPADREGRHEGEAAPACLPTYSEPDAPKARPEPAVNPAGHVDTPAQESASDGLAGTACAQDAEAANIKPAPIQESVGSHEAAVASEYAGTSPDENPAPFKPRPSLRPHCQHPDNCAGYGSKHCHTCLKAHETEGAAA